MGMRFIFIPLSPFGKAEKLQKRRKGQKWQASGNPERGRTLGPHLRSATLLWCSDPLRVLATPHVHPHRRAPNISKAIKTRSSMATGEGKHEKKRASLASKRNCDRGKMELSGDERLDLGAADALRYSCTASL